MLVLDAKIMKKFNQKTSILQPFQTKIIETNTFNGIINQTFKRLRFTQGGKISDRSHVFCLAWGKENPEKMSQSQAGFGSEGICHWSKSFSPPAPFPSTPSLVFNFPIWAFLYIIRQACAYKMLAHFFLKQKQTLQDLEQTLSPPIIFVFTNFYFYFLW